MVRHINNKVISISDQEGRAVNLPLRGPVPFPLQDSEGSQIRAEDLVPVQLAVDLEENEKIGNNKTKQRGGSRWSLAEEFAKVIEKAFSLGYVLKDRTRETKGDKSQEGRQCAGAKLEHGSGNCQRFGGRSGIGRRL